MFEAFWKEVGSWLRHIEPRLHMTEDDKHVTVIIHVPKNVLIQDIKVYPSTHMLHLAYAGKEVHRLTDEDRGYLAERATSQAFELNYPFPKAVTPESMQVKREGQTLQLIFQKRSI
ncbi:MAG: Hsp20/alpha crystallin family protein [Candidatus Carbobacillus sp.]|nr:Hsp20/alpha crystallin family protein [Candidatus Carbobacillus sp.]